MRKQLLPRLAAIVLVLALVTASFSGCGLRDLVESENTFVLYYLNNDETSFITSNYTPLRDQVADLAEEMREGLLEWPTEQDRKRLLPDGLTMEIGGFEDRTLTLVFSDSYYDMEKTREVLVRAGVVRTFVQIDGIDRVLFYVGSEPLTDDEGHAIGAMRRETFVDNSAQQVNNYERNAVRLYFANEAGDALVEEPRAIYHSSSQPLEWAVVARLIEGPKAAGSFAVLPPETEIISVSTSNEICYVNLNRAFMNSTLNVSEEIPVYAIVNSLVASCSVKQVQIAIEGDIKVTFRDTMRLDTLYEENRDLVEKAS